MSAPSFKLQLPPRSLFKWPPDPYPIAIPPPTDARTFASPFPIPAKLFNDVLDWKVPVVIGSVYMTSAIIMNKINRNRNNVPWAISKTTAFHYFVLAHNIFLAVFSALTFIGMIRALAHSWPGRREALIFGRSWPGLRTENGLAGAADALCKLHGPRDLGDAVYYDPATHAWRSSSRLVKLGINKTPDQTDVGRLWNEGLAFWGWWFYLSKFYEVLDTVIILAKGKRSSTLQTYHHTGAMACMWAGIRYMSPPIWMFCFINSGIHAMMYTYYTLSALRIRVPQGIKRSLTTMQISQFLIGITFATLHLFVYYSVPVATPFTKTVSQAVSAGASAVSAAASRAPEAAVAALPSIGSFVKKVLLRAAGEEGMAQRVSAPTDGAHLAQILANATDASGSGSGASAHPKTHTTWRTQYEYVPCIDTTGQAFAIWLNVFYLAPLTLLFVRFFIRSYSRRGAANSKNSKPSSRISKAAEDAAKGTNREVDDIGKAAEDGVSDIAQNVLKKLNQNTPKNNAKGSKKRSTQDQFKDENTHSTTPERSGSMSSKSDKTNNGSDNLTVGQIRKKASAEHNKLRQKFEDGQHTFDRLVSSDKADASLKTKNSGLDRPQTPQSQSTKFVDDLSNTLPQNVEKLEKDAEQKVMAVREAVGGQAARAAEGVKNLAGDVKSTMEDSMSGSKFSELGSFSMVDKKELDGSVAALDKKEKNTDGKIDHEGHSLAQEIEEGHAPTFAEVAHPDELDSQNTPASKVDSADASAPSYAEVADPDESTNISSKTETGLDVKSRSNSSDSEDRKRSQSPSKRSSKSKIPQARSRQSTSPVKKIISQAKPTTSMAAHSGAALPAKTEEIGTGNK